MGLEPTMPFQALPWQGSAIATMRHPRNLCITYTGYFFLCLVFLNHTLYAPPLFVASTLCT